jgi:hypothetical protein
MMINGDGLSFCVPETQSFIVMLLQVQPKCLICPISIVMYLMAIAYFHQISVSALAASLH